MTGGRSSGITRRLALVAVVAAAIVLLPAVATGEPETAHVTLLQASLTPSRTVVLVGDSVSWLNASFRDHTVTAHDGLFDSGLVSAHRGFSYSFSAPGIHLYACKLHPSVAGEVDVYPLLLSGPAGAVYKGASVTLSGRAAQGTAAVTVERVGGGPVQTVAVRPGGSFRANVIADATASYRAVAGSLTSPEVQVSVADRAQVVLAAGPARRGTRLRTKVLPPAPDARVALQPNLRERFGWWTVASAHVDARSQASFVLRRRYRGRIRAVLTGADGYSIQAASNVVRIRPRR